MLILYRCAERVNYPWLATPYLPAAQLYFALVEWIAPQTLTLFKLEHCYWIWQLPVLAAVLLKKVNIWQGDFGIPVEPADRCGIFSSTC